MTLRAYLTLLRPWRALVAAALLLSICSLLMAAVGISLEAFAFFFGCGVAPLVTGIVLIAPLHEAAHRSSFPMLPGAPLKFLKRHLVTFTFAALLLFGLCALCVTSIPVPAACGLILTGLALPLINPGHRNTVGINRWFGLLLLLGMATTGFTHAQIIALCHAAPWTLFFGGLAFCVACFRFGFARDHLRARSANPLYYAPQSTLAFVGTDILQHAQTEIARQAEQRNNRRGAVWSTAPFQDTLRDWLKIINHARFGYTRLSRCELSVFVGTLLGTLAALLVSGLISAGVDLQKWETYCRLIVEAAHASGQIADGDVRLLFVMVPHVGFSVALGSALVAAVPAQLFPLARARLADAHFLAFERRVILAIAGSVAGTVAALTAAAFVANQPWSVALLHRFLTLPAIGVIAANLTPTVVFSDRPLVRFLAGLLTLSGFIIATFTVVLRDSGPKPSVLNTLMLGALALCSIAFAWFTFRRHYRTCDLARSSDCLRRIGFRLT